MNVAPKKDILHRWIYGRANGIFSSSEIINKEIRERYPVDPARVHLLRYGVALEKFISDETIRLKVRNALGIQENEILVGMMGRIDRQKGVREFAESYMLLPEDKRAKIKYLIIGEQTILRTEKNGTIVYEPESKACDEYIRSFIAMNNIGRNVLRLGYQNDIVPFLNAMDIFALPSYAEMYSLSVIDAMAMGLPVIGTKAGGTEEQLAGGNRGILIESKSSEAIAQAVTFYANNPQIRAAHGEEARTFARENHSMEKTIARLIDFYSGKI
jgi:D-inositol-3-phosphate glycosyltransferase